MKKMSSCRVKYRFKNTHKVTVLGNCSCDEGLAGSSAVNYGLHLARTILTTIDKRVQQPYALRETWSTYALKFVMVAVKLPSALATIGVVEARVEAIFTLPHSLAVDGLWTSLRTGVPATPRAGEMIA